MTAIDRAALIKVTARRLHRIDCGCPEPDAPDHSVNYSAMVEDSLPIIVATALKPIREMHVGRYFRQAHRAGDLRGHGALVVCCRACGNVEPCPTVRLCDEIEADVKGGQ